MQAVIQQCYLKNEIYKGKHLISNLAYNTIIVSLGVLGLAIVYIPNNVNNTIIYHLRKNPETAYLQEIAESKCLFLAILLSSMT